MSHAKLEENGNDAGTDNYVLKQKETSVIRKFNTLKIFSALLFIVIVFLVLDICGVFDSSSSSDDSTAELTTLSVSPHDTGSSGGDVSDNDYLTGTQAPNMLFLLADDIGWADISANGGMFETPNIDELLTGGIQYTSFYTQSLCTPSRMAFLTGRYAWKLGVQYPEDLHGMMTGHIPQEERTYAEVTREMGYDNYYIGKWGVGYASWDFTPLGRGWDYFMGFFGVEGGYYNHTTDHFDDWYGVYDMWDADEPFIEANMTYSEDLFLSRTLDWLAQANEKGVPFTMTYAAQTAHAPIDDDWPTYYPPIRWTECDNTLKGREYFCNKVKYLDYTWGILLDYLKDQGMWDNMIIFITTDNGALPYTGHDLYSDWGCNWPLRSGKVTHFEGGIKVWAGITGGLIPVDDRGSTIDSLTHITDFAATAMRLSMTKSQFESRSTLTGTDKIVDGLNLYEYEHHELVIHNVLPQYIPSWLSTDTFDYAVTDGEWKYLVGVSESAAQEEGWYNFPGFGIIDEDSDYYTYWEAGGNCRNGCLFHLASDPSEYHDVSYAYGEVVDYFSDLINAVYQGGFDYSYHSGQPFEEDYRGFMADNILRPYLNEEAIWDFEDRTHSVENDGNYDYESAERSYLSDYSGEGSPFE